VRLIRGRAEARWLPSRHRFALFRLYAFLRLRSAKPEPRRGLVLVVDRDQTAFEHHGVSLWVVATITCYFAAGLFGAWPLPAALLAGLASAAVAIEVPVWVGGFIFGRAGRANGVATMAALIAASIHFARQTTWVRFAAWQFLGLIAINAVASLIVFLLRAPIARLERGVVSES
jgi:hypothetical protein